MFVFKGNCFTLFPFSNPFDKSGANLEHYQNKTLQFIHINSFVEKDKSRPTTAIGISLLGCSKIKLDKPQQFDRDFRKKSNCSNKRFWLFTRTT